MLNKDRAKRAAKETLILFAIVILGGGAILGVSFFFVWLGTINLALGLVSGIAFLFLVMFAMAYFTDIGGHSS